MSRSAVGQLPRAAAAFPGGGGSLGLERADCGVSAAADVSIGGGSTAIDQAAAQLAEDLAFTSVLTEADLAGFRAGESDAVRSVYRAYGGLVFTVALRVLGDRSLAEEATQQAFVQAWRASSSFDPTRDLGPWLATIARRAAIDVHRREARRSHDRLDDVAAGHPAVVVLPEQSESPYDAWEVRQALAALPPEEREVVRLQHFVGLTHSAIAEQLDIPLGTVKSRSGRAYRRLAEMLGHLKEGIA